MQTVQLADTGRRTTRLGFGGSSIMGGLGRTDSLRVLEWAYEAGVRHFDVAPMYGYGEAEACLGEFLTRHPGEMTITTKFGIPSGKSNLVKKLVRSAARPLVKALPLLKARAQRAAATVDPAPETRDLSARQAQLSLEHSLRALRVSRIDLFLLHDATLAEVRDPSLLAFLEDAKQKGTIGAYGIGTEREHAINIRRDAAAIAGVVQQEWSVFDPPPEVGAFPIHHRSLAGNRMRLQAHLKASPDAAIRWSQETGADLLKPGVLSALMMRSALAANQDGIVLFSSKNREHIKANASLTTPSPEDEQAAVLYRLVQREAVGIPEIAS